MNLILLKLGGSALTAKSAGRKKINARVLRQTSKTLAKFIHKNPSWKILLVHGAGPFGHQTVLEYGIRNGVRSARHREGFAKTHSEMLRLNSLVMEFLLREGTSAISFSPLELLTQHNKKIRSFNTVPIENA
ncbi:MAG: hypothetical protein HY917_05590, partial [Candidatus Diapherotrites archaeon]|nr:hypothetical protein [Candidatus Diapherotrites archaeon]